jgi:RNA polymerase sigma-70 factor, ECF subfamily
VSSSFPAARFLALPLAQEKAAEPPSRETVASPPQELTDEVLIERICGDDREALGLLFRRYCRLVWSVGQRILRNREEADDLLQDVFLSVRQRATRFDPSKGTARSFLVHITYQRAISHRRYLCRRHFYCAADPQTEAADRILPQDDPAYDGSLEAHFGRAALQKALSDLSPEQRETLRLYFFEGHSLEEIAAQTGQAYGNVRHYYYRALDKLRKHLPTDRGGDS